jgi:uncharacterized protein (TIGR02001 family)
MHLGGAFAMVSSDGDECGRARAFAVAIAGAALLCVEAVAGSAARAQVSEYGSAGAISLGARGWAVPQATQAMPPRDGAADELQFSARAGLATDYIYRGTTLSDHQPAVGAAIEATFASVYAGAALASVTLPTRPAAEITMIGGVRPTLGKVDFDFGLSYFAYPGETPGNDTDYWEAAARADTKIGESIRIAGGFAYSPSVSNTGAWSQYAALGAGFEVPARLLPQDIGVSFTAAAGYSRFGNQSADLGGFPLPAYLNWQAGVTFTRKLLNLDLRYYDTNLSKEDCFVFTGDHTARPGGRVDPVTNPDGLVSRWCSATFVAKLWFELGSN